MFDWAYGGVNASIPRNIGPECAEYLTPQRRIIETILATIIIVACVVWSLKRINVPKPVPYVNQDRLGKKILLIAMSLTLGTEIGFKFSSRTVIYILNPCHITTAIQLYLLAAEPSHVVTAIFRVHLNLLNGPVLGFAFPETASRKIFADQAVYYIEHGLMFVIPYYLLRLGGAYNVEPLTDMSWCVLGYAVMLAYHFLVLQPIALPAQVNLSHMLCPAILDPFDGPNYRLWAIAHQALLCPLVYKLFCIISEFLLTKFPVTKVKASLEMPIQRNGHYVETAKKLHKNLSSFENNENSHTHVD